MARQLSAVGDSASINCREKKKTVENALIPLPPTGFASVFYANPDVVQTIL
jgi:hypothetical protein